MQTLTMGIVVGVAFGAVFVATLAIAATALERLARRHEAARAANLRGKPLRGIAPPMAGEENSQQEEEV